MQTIPASPTGPRSPRDGPPSAEPPRPSALVALLFVSLPSCSSFVPPAVRLCFRPVSIHQLAQHDAGSTGGSLAITAAPATGCHTANRSGTTSDAQREHDPWKPNAADDPATRARRTEHEHRAQSKPDGAGLSETRRPLRTTRPQQRSSDESSQMTTNQTGDRHSHAAPVHSRTQTNL